MPAKKNTEDDGAKKEIKKSGRRNTYTKCAA